MNNTLSKVFIFVTGAAIGSLVTWKLVKEKYAREAREDIEEIRKYYKDKNKSEEDDYEPLTEDDCIITEEEAKRLELQKDKDEYNKIVESYTGKKVVDTIEIQERPFVIEPDEFGLYDDYETVTLTYYADHVLTDEMDEVIKNVDETVGEDSLTHFGEYEDDVVYVRNDQTKTDYEILMDDAIFAELYPELVGEV